MTQLFFSTLIYDSHKYMDTKKEKNKKRIKEKENRLGCAET